MCTTGSMVVVPACCLLLPRACTDALSHELSQLHKLGASTMHATLDIRALSSPQNPTLLDCLELSLQV